jgi:Lactate racemase N-terminal domain
MSLNAMSQAHINIPGGLDFSMPRMLPVRQRFERHTLGDVAAAVRAEIARPEIAATISRGACIAIGVGSRGVANIGIVVKTLVAELKARGAAPLVFPAMGSHGGGDAQEQAGLLAGYGITEAKIGAPVRATMETVVVAHTEHGVPIHMDKYAHEADGVVLINRVKPHPAFRGAVESGVMKMMIIGMGKIAGASAIHRGYPLDDFGAAIPRAAEVLMGHIPFLFGIGLVEDAFDTTAIVEAMTGQTLFARESRLLVRAKELMARLLFEDIDVLVIDEIGKNVSGGGADANVTGRSARNAPGFNKPRVAKKVFLDLTDATKGNAAGIAAADVITKRLFERIDFGVTYSNLVASTYLEAVKTPIPMADGDSAVRLAVRTLRNREPLAARIVRIRNTLDLVNIHVSEPMRDHVAVHSRLEITGEPVAMSFG